MTKSGIRIEGMDDLRRLLERGNTKVIKATGQAVTEVTNDVARKSAELVPFDTGALRRSRAMKFPTPGRKNIVGEITYGGPGAPYAVVQHENLDLWHPPKPPGKQKSGKHRQGTGPISPGQGRGPKYLEQPLKMARKDFDKIIINRIKALIR